MAIDDQYKRSREAQRQAFDAYFGTTPKQVESKVRSTIKDKERRTNQPLAKQEYFRSQGMSLADPYGAQKSAVGKFFEGIASAFGTTPNYSNIPETQRRQILENQYSKYINPTNDPNLRGYNPRQPSGNTSAGILRSGVRPGQTVIDPSSNQPTTVQEFRQPQSVMDKGAGILAALNIPGSSFLIDRATRVKGLEGVPPMVDGQQATPLSSGILRPLEMLLSPGTSSIPGVKQGTRYLDNVIGKANELISQGSQVQKNQETINGGVTTLPTDRNAFNQNFRASDLSPAGLEVTGLNRGGILNRYLANLTTPSFGGPADAKVNQRTLDTAN